MNVDYLRSNPKRSAAIFIVLIMVLGTVSGALIYRNRINTITNELENSEFIVTKFDLVDSTENSLLAEGEAEIRGDFSSSNNRNLVLHDMTIILSNNSESITQITVPISNDDLDSGINFELEIPVEQENPSTLTADILTYIMIGTNFTLDFRGIISYEWYGIAGELNFDNIVKFQLEQEFLSFDLRYFDLFSQNTPQINFTLYNPFSLGITLLGDIDIVVQDVILGEISLSPTFFGNGATNILEEVDSLIALPDLFEKYFDNIQNPVILDTNLVMSLGQVSVNVSPQLTLNSNGLGLNFVLTALNSLNLNTYSGELDANINATLVSDLPLALNISKLSGDLVVDESVVGNFHWNSTAPVFLPPNLDKEFSFIIINSSLVNSGFFTTLFQEFSFRNLEVEIYLDNIPYTYYISRI